MNVWLLEFFFLRDKSVMLFYLLSFMELILNGLSSYRERNSRFNEALSQIESDPICQSLSLHSFLMLPMQRITRLPLLIDAILSRIESDDEEFQTVQITLATLNKVSN